MCNVPGPQGSCALSPHYPNTRGVPKLVFSPHTGSGPASHAFGRADTKKSPAARHLFQGYVLVNNR
jgi:hypothetical protein